VCRCLAERYGWTPQEIGALSIPQLLIYAGKKKTRSTGKDWGNDFDGARESIMARRALEAQEGV